MREIIWKILVVVGFGILLVKAAFLQIVEGEKNSFLAETNRLRKLEIFSPRGLILDRHGEVLAGNEPVYLVDGKEVSREEALVLQAEKKDADVLIQFRRKYFAGREFAHVIGYLGKVSEKELSEEKLSLKGYGSDDWIGRMGVERQYEEILRGQKGSRLVEVDISGEMVREISRVDPAAGKSLTLAIEKELQEKASQEMEGKKGAVVATNPKTGEVLILYSSPSFDPSLFLEGKNWEEIQKIITDEKNQPLLNRAISGVYQPGSTFKIVTSIAGLEEGKITPTTLIADTGVIRVGSYSYANWYFTQYGKTEGEISLAKAIARSTDTFFYKVGEYLGVESLISWAKRFGLDSKFGIDLPGEIAGFIGTPEWKEKTRGEKWFLGNTYHLAIGQGDLDLTPLGVNLMTGVVASGGKICQPRILRIGAENTPYRENCRDLGIRKENLEVVREGMGMACSPGGTGWPFFNFEPKVGCKTGTAETGDGKTTHAWFTVFAPLDDPEIVLTVLVEKGGEGSSVAAPIAREILEVWRQKR